MKYSIVIPVYKVEKYLHECVDSVLAQTFQDYEIILVDDGSPDSCPQICDDYAKRDSRIKVIHQKNAGIACARNTGIAEASGEYLLCIDSDDYLSDNNILSQLSKCVETTPDVVLLGYRKFFESSGYVGAAEIPSNSGVCTVSKMLGSELKNNTYGGAAWTKLVRLGLLKDNSIQFRPGMVSFEDSDWFLNVMLKAKTYTSYDKPVVTYRQREGSISHSVKLQSLIDAVWILETWPNRIKEMVGDKATVNALMSVMAFYYGNDMVLFSGYPAKVSAPYKNRFKSQSYLLDYAVTPRALTIRKFYKLFGFDLTILLLKVLAKLKRRQ